ncbi:hypothetical protein, partial [Flavobacterium sp. ACAM 123]|uniref:hypothetical protein n=1 Tax=Flavobacterium sp. ACAM 123 TaxID=1189620 RepID=UPI001E3FC358
FAPFRSSSPHGHFLRSSGLLQPQYSFIPLRFVNSAALQSAVSCLSPLIFSAVALFAQPSGSAPFDEKPHFALNQGFPPKKVGSVLFFSRRYTLLSASFRSVYPDKIRVSSTPFPRLW